MVWRCCCCEILFFHFLSKQTGRLGVLEIEDANEVYGEIEQYGREGEARLRFKCERGRPA